MKRKKFLALALAGVMTAVTLTACAPLETLYDWFFGGGSGSASRGNGVNLVELNDNDYNGLKSQIMDRLGLKKADVFTDRSRKALEEVVGKLDAAMLDTDNKLNTAGQTALNEVAKNQLPQNWSGMCIDVMKLSPTSADAVPAISEDRTLYWAEYTHGNGGTFGVGSVEEEGHPVSNLPTYKSELNGYWFVKTNIGNRKENSKVDLFAGTFTKDGETYLAVVALWELSWLSLIHI